MTLIKKQIYKLILVEFQLIEGINVYVKDKGYQLEHLCSIFKSLIMYCTLLQIFHHLLACVEMQEMKPKYTGHLMNEII
jgi:hypothetical protein